MGLTALHYATWNGHVECVKYLLCNPYGVDYNGSRCSSLDLVSVKNYSPLHLVALDCPEWSSKEICHLLLLFGLDRHGLDCDGHTPLEICTLQNNELVLEAFKEYDELLQTQNQPIVPPFKLVAEKDEEMEKVLEDSDFEMGSPIPRYYQITNTLIHFLHTYTSNILYNILCYLTNTLTHLTTTLVFIDDMYG